MKGRVLLKVSLM